MSIKITTKEEYAKRINVIVEYINNHLDEKINLKKLAEISNFSTFHFHRIFKGLQEETLAVYISRIRLERASYMLRYTNLPIETIASNVGFIYPSSLSKAFRQLYNMTPAAYRTNRDYSIIKRTKVDSEMEMIWPEIVEMKSKTVIYIRLKGPYNISKYPEIWDRLYNFAKRQGINPEEMEHLGIYHDDISVTKTDKLRSEVCLSINKPIRAEGEIGIKTIYGGKYAVFLYDGPFNNKCAIYDLIFSKWLPESGYEIRDIPIYEKYLTNPKKPKSGKLVTEVYLPLN
jgi:AraC family transcriptional regulator